MVHNRSVFSLVGLAVIIWGIAAVGFVEYVAQQQR
jgi:hypothetical protein